MTRVLVYEHRARDSGREGLRTMSTQDLDDYLYFNPHLQATRKPTYRRSSVEVYQYDLYTDFQKEIYQDTPNFHTNIATVTIGYPGAIQWTELIILSDKKD